jgi:hypothetical protein
VLKEKQIGFLVKLFACKKVCVNLVKSRGLSHGKPKALPVIPEPIVPVPLFIGGSTIAKKR